MGVDNWPQQMFDFREVGEDEAAAHTTNTACFFRNFAPHNLSTKTTTPSVMLIHLPENRSLYFTLLITSNDSSHDLRVAFGKPLDAQDVHTPVCFFEVCLFNCVCIHFFIHIHSQEQYILQGYKSLYFFSSTCIYICTHIATYNPQVRYARYAINFPGPNVACQVLRVLWALLSSSMLSMTGIHLGRFEKSRWMKMWT